MSAAWAATGSRSHSTERGSAGVAAFASEVREAHGIVDTLICNAGLNTGSEAPTEDGLELRFQVSAALHTHINTTHNFLAGCPGSLRCCY